MQVSTVSVELHLEWYEREFKFECNQCKRKCMNTYIHACRRLLLTPTSGINANAWKNDGGSACQSNRVYKRNVKVNAGEMQMPILY